MSQPWKVILAFAGVFLAGAIAGGPLALRLLRHDGPEYRRTSSRGLGPEIMRHFTERLDLTPEQKEKIRPIIQRAQAETQRLRRENIRNLAATIEQMAAGTYPWRIFDAFDLGVPALRVDTTNGYTPSLAAIVEFCRAGRGTWSIEGGAHAWSSMCR